MTPADEPPAVLDAVRRAAGLHNWLFLDPLLRGYFVWPLMDTVEWGMATASGSGSGARPLVLPGRAPGDLQRDPLTFLSRRASRSARR